MGKWLNAHYINTNKKSLTSCSGPLFPKSETSTSTRGKPSASWQWCSTMCHCHAF